MASALPSCLICRPNNKNKRRYEQPNNSVFTFVCFRCLHETLAEAEYIPPYTCSPLLSCLSTTWPSFVDQLRSTGARTSINNHSKSNKRTGKERTAADRRKAFSAHRADAATWFRAFREDLAKADMLKPGVETPPSGGDTVAFAAAQSRNDAVTRKVLAVLRDVCSGAGATALGAGRGRVRGAGGGKSSLPTLGGGGGGGGYDWERGKHQVNKYPWFDYAVGRAGVIFRQQHSYTKASRSRMSSQLLGVASVSRNGVA